jgi:acetoin utilization deacetylase AcuC-like enzyme
MRKLPFVARMAEDEGLVDLVDPGSIPLDKLAKLHDPAYVLSFLAGQGKLAESNSIDWNRNVRDGVLAINAGQLVAAENAFKYGIAANIGQGFHHAVYNEGASFCTFNGLALVAQENPDKKVFVLDCDEHGGNGTQEFTERLKNLYNFTINGDDFGCTNTERSTSITLKEVTADFRPYNLALNKAFDKIINVRPDIILYQAGMDPHKDDPCSQLLMTAEQLRIRDRMVFKFAKEQAIPLMFVLAGGYQEPIKERLVPLHVNTFREAFSVYNG